MKIKAQDLKKHHVVFCDNAYTILDKEPIVVGDSVFIGSCVTFKKDEVVDVLSVRNSRIRTFDREDSILQLSDFTQTVRKHLASSAEFMSDIRKKYSSGLNHLCPSLTFLSYGSLEWCSYQKILYRVKKGSVVSMQKERCPFVIFEGGSLLSGNILLMRDGMFVITAEADSGSSNVFLVTIPEHE